MSSSKKSGLGPPHKDPAQTPHDANPDNLGQSLAPIGTAADNRPQHGILTIQGQAADEGGRRILVVDDDPLMRDYIEALLTSLNYAVILAKNGEDALRLLATEDKVDLLFTDIMMGDGGMNGWELARCALALRPDLPILFTSAYPDAAAAILHELPAAKNLLRKPYRSRDLSRAILASLAAAYAPDPSP